MKDTRLTFLTIKCIWNSYTYRPSMVSVCLVG